tara:strand:- start:36 stop:662 length:627 start_codon:yes stop_codon:yes gene_type:complete
MTKPDKDLNDLQKQIKRHAVNILQKGVVSGAEDVVKELQHIGPSWTGVYSNSWQIEIAGQKGTGTRRQGNPKPVKGPKLTLSQVRKAASAKGQVDLEIRNLRQKRIKGYAEDTIEGRFTRGEKGGKKIGQEPRTRKGRKRLETNTSEGRLIEGFRGDIGGGKLGGISSRTAKLDWLPTYLKGGSLKQTLDLAIKKAENKSKSQNNKLK